MELNSPSDITTVQSLKFDFGTQVMALGDSIVIQWPMRVPINTSITGQPAWNSFGYIATRDDNNSVLLPSEPIKVGIESNPVNPALIGNYIWYDNNTNGIQDEGTANGQNNLRVDLFQKLGAIRNPFYRFINNLYSFKQFRRKSGYYQFSNIPNGNYYVAVHLPTHYIGTLANAGGNDNLDSDGSLLVNISGDSLLLTDDIVVTGAESVYMGFDLGIHPICDSPISATASVNSPICDGGTANFTGVSVGGTSFSWTGPNGFTWEYKIQHY
ncbi:MAG: hypothetical protein IPH28_17040 [Cytophagaceae bacterium]|nr:hypothetical protein [Cytophagaceae bacterium]